MQFLEQDEHATAVVVSLATKLHPHTAIRSQQNNIMVPLLSNIRLHVLQESTATLATPRIHSSHRRALAARPASRLEARSQGYGFRKRLGSSLQTTAGSAGGVVRSMGDLPRI